MLRISRVRQALVVTGITSLVLASTLVAGATTMSGKFNAADAKLVPAAYKGTTLQVATDATYAPDESMSGTTMVGFDIDLLKAVATTLNIKIHENSVTFANILAGIDSGKYQIGNSSFTDEKIQIGNRPLEGRGHHPQRQDSREQRHLRQHPRRY